MNNETYMEDSAGRQVPVSMIKEIDLLRDQTVRTIMQKTSGMTESLRNFKTEIWADIEAFLSLSAEQHGVKFGGKKGNITLISFDGKYKIQVAVADNKVFNEKLQVAKALIDNCIKRWSEGSRPEIRVLVDDAFQVDKQGNINTGRVLGLRRLKIEDPEWREAMSTISDSLQITDSKTYMRFYRREAYGRYKQIPLDVAVL